jgi:hypothetical protein
VKCGILVTKPLFTSAEGTEILSSVWDDIVIKLEVDTTGASCVCDRSQSSLLLQKQPISLGVDNNGEDSSM